MSALVFFLAAVCVDIDFSAHEPGMLRDRVHPHASPGWTWTKDAYGRKPVGRSSLAEYVSGRDGHCSAIETGCSGREPSESTPALALPTRAALSETEDSTQVLWFLLHAVGRDGELPGGAVLVNCDMGVRRGFRLDYARSRDLKGRLSLILGNAAGDGTRCIRTDASADVACRVWHQAVIVRDAAGVRLFLDGMCVGSDADGFRRTGKRLAVSALVSRASRTRVRIDRYQIHDRAWTASEVAEDWRLGQPKIGGGTLPPPPPLPALEGVRDGLCVVGSTVHVVLEGRTVLSKRLTHGGLSDVVWNGYRFPVCVVEAFPKQRTALGALDLSGRQSVLRHLGVHEELMHVRRTAVEPERGAYEWADLDARVETCRANGCTPVLLLADEDARRPLGRLLASRYRAEVVVPDAVVVVPLEQEATLGARLDQAQSTGRRVFLAPPSNPSWDGVCSFAFRGRPPAALPALVEWMRKESHSPHEGGKSRTKIRIAKEKERK